MVFEGSPAPFADVDIDIRLAFPNESVNRDGITLATGQAGENSVERL